MAIPSRLKARNSTRTAPALTSVARIAADALPELSPEHVLRQAAAAEASPANLPTASVLVAPRDSGNLGGYFLGQKKGRGNLGGFYRGPLSREQRRATPAPPVEVATATGTAQIPQSEVNKNPNSTIMSETKKTTQTASETVPGHEKTVETKTEGTQHQPETKVETKTEKTELKPE